METIASSGEISQLFAHGRRVGTPYATLIVGPQGPSLQHRHEVHDHTGRVAFIAGKKLGNAVWRNRAKRRMREICRQLGGPWPGLDVIFLARPALTQATYSKVLAALEKATARIIDEEQPCEDD